MAIIDPEQERRRLADHYSRQIDGRLEQVASQAYELGDIAREVLREELSRRGLGTDLTEVRPIPQKIPDPEVPQPVVEPPAAIPIGELITIRQFRDLPEALLAKAFLESAGVRCFLEDDNLVRLDWFYSNAIGGIKLLVDADELADAIDLLDQPIPDHLDVSGLGDFDQPRCPRCGSLDVNFRESDPAAYVVAWVLRLPIPLHRSAWRCRACRAEWEEIPDQNQSTTGSETSSL